MSSHLTPEEYVRRAKALKPRLRARAEEAERGRRMPDATVADFLDNEFHLIMLPKRYGGCAYGWDVWCECLNIMAQGCASQAWAMMVHVEYQQLVGACDVRLQDDIWGDSPRNLISSSFQPVGKVEPTEGGYNLSTVGPPWSFSSGIDEASWLIVGGIAPGRGWTFFLVPKSEVNIIDDWHAFGLAGTGSKSFTIKQTFVPAYRTITDAELTDGKGPGVTDQSASIHRYPRKAGAGLAIASVPIGAAIGMLEDFEAMARERTQSNPSAADSATAILVAECAAELDAARRATLDVAREAMQVLDGGGELPIEQRLIGRRSAGFGITMAQRASERLFAAAGGMANYRSSSLQRAFRDVHAGSNHMGVSWEMAATPYGNYKLGLQPPPGSY